MAGGKLSLIYTACGQLAIVYQVDRTGVITPVAHLHPTLLAGTMVKRVSLHNAGEIERLGLSLGDGVFIGKGGDIIPKVTPVDPTQVVSPSNLLRIV